MRESRLLSMLILLQLRGRLTADDLALEFETSVRTIYRGIDQLSAAGVPVHAVRGRAGGFVLDPAYRTTLTGFTPAEAEALLIAGAGRAAADLGRGREAELAQMKLLASLPASSGARAQQVASRFHLDPHRWYSRPERIAALPQIATAVWTDRRLRIQYDSWKAHVTRCVDPLGLVLKGGLWYLVGAVDGQPRTYRVSGIRRFEVLDAAARRPARFVLERYWSRWVEEFEARLLRERATIRITTAGLQLLRELSPAAAEAVDAASGGARSLVWREATIPIEGIDHAALQLLRLGREVEVLQPPALRAAILREARAVAARYRRRRVQARGAASA